MHMPHSASIALNLARYLRRNEPFAYLGLPNTRLLSQDICLKPAQAGRGEQAHRKWPRHGTLPFGSRGGVCITIRAAVSTGAHNTLLQGACAAPFCKGRRCCASLRGVLRSVKLMRVIFPTRGGINRLSRLARLPASAPQDHLIGGSSLFFLRFARALTNRRHGVPQRRKEKARRFLYALFQVYCIALFVWYTSTVMSIYVQSCPLPQKWCTASSCSLYTVVLLTRVFP